MDARKPVALIILDGWGIRTMEHGNAVIQAQTPHYDNWMRSLERSILDASGEAVGLPADQMGNSEVGHLNLGAGRIIYQDITRIDRAIAHDELTDIDVLTNELERATETGSTVHLIGLLGAGGVHSHSRHLYALLNMAQQHGIEPVLHMITDGRDTSPHSGREFLRELEAFLRNEAPGRIASVSGRYFAMDRDKRWDRTQKAFDAMAHRAGKTAPSASEAITQAYEAGETDEFITPTVVVGNDDQLRIAPGDTVICFNFRADRMRQLVRLLINAELDGYSLANAVSDLHVLTMTEYEEGLPVAGLIFAPQTIDNPLAQVLSRHGLRQFHAAETEKYAHVTYFFNGGEEQQFDGEERLLVPSPKVATYDLQPEMSAYELAEKVAQRIAEQDDDFILVNFANPDMVGHTGDLAAATRAVEATDECAGKLVDAVRQKGGVVLVTADHGNAERMIDEVSGGPHTYHTTSPVSLFVMADGYVGVRPRGILADVAPTVLDLLGVPQPAEMTGRSLLTDAL